MGKILITVGAILVIAGVIIHFAGKASFFGNLPGDFKFERGNMKVYFPLATSLLVSVVITILIYIIQKLKG